MFDWDEGDRFSFEDSDRFEEDSLCSWISEPESLCNNWRGWKKQNGNNNSGHHYYTYGKPKEGQVLSLVEASARVVACHIPFEIVEHVCPPVPEQLQLRIAFWSFPENEEDIRLYSCLANGSADEFQRGEHLFRARAVKDLLQIGFHLSATVIPPQSISVSKTAYNVAVTFDRCRITSCSCTCNSTASWCSHVVAVCLHRIHQPTQVRLRAPVSESLSRLHRDQLQKFAQYLISELPQQQILPTAQRLLDELLSNQHTINSLPGAPDPTAGASADSQTSWCLDESTLHENIRKILIKLCVPSPIVFSDVNYLSSTAPPAASEWSSLLRPLRGREPEGMWNLLSIVREMFRRNDRNAIPLLAILTEEVLSCDQILVWWFNTKVSLHTGSGNHCGRSVHSNTHASQHACSSLCDEIVVLWRLAALNPALSPQDRNMFFIELHEWHLKVLDKVWKLRNSSSVGASGIRRSDIDIFTGFKPAMEACLLDWSDYPINGITFLEGGARRWYSPYFQAKPSNGPNDPNHPTVSGSEDCSHGHNHCRRIGRSLDLSQAISHWGNLHERRTILIHAVHNTQNNTTIAPGRQPESNRSSLSSEGFCENDNVDGSDLERLGNNGSYSIAVSKNEPISIDFSQPGTSKAASDESQAGTSKPSNDDAGTSTGQVESKPSDCDNDSDGSNTNRHPVDGKGEASESQQSSDEYQMYYYDPQAKLPDNKEKKEEEKFLVSVKKIEDPLEVLFARAEALHAHGYTLEACTLAVKLAEQLLVNPPNLMVELPPPTARGKKGRRFNPASHQISLLASATLAKAAFLSTVLAENVEHHHLAFCVALFGLELARPPASTKALEVKLANQEQDVVLLLKKIPLTDKELKVVRDRAEQLRNGQLRSRGEALLPLMLASFIFDALVLSGNGVKVVQPSNSKLSADEILGFEAAVAALGLKANVSEAEHPLLCEGTRRQRGDLVINLLVHYKDDQEKLVKIMDKLLDKEMHQMYKAPVLNPYLYSSNTPTNMENSSTAAGNEDYSPTQDGNSTPLDEMEQMTKRYEIDYGHMGMCDLEQQTQALRISTAQQDGSMHGVHMKDSHRHNYRLRNERSDGGSSPGWEEDYKAWEAKFRCTNFRTTKKHSAGMASIDSSAPETTSSDNSPTVVRRSTWIRTTGPGSDSGSSGESSDSFASSSSGDKITRPKLRDTERGFHSFIPNDPKSLVFQKILRTSVKQSPHFHPCTYRFLFSGCISPPQSVPMRFTTPFNPGEGISRTIVANAKLNRSVFNKGKRVYPSVPNQPSEASAHFMFELAKTVLVKAGGNSSNAVLFTQPSSSQNHRGPHRGLHMCAFQIGLYALGLHNAVSPNWLSRTYSSHVSWITGQAVEIGSAAINFLIDTWEGHLTPPEVASLADRASRGRDPSMVRAAAELALSCLPHAHALNPNEIQRALIQCKEQSSEMLERACLAVESAAKGGGVYPEVLFDVARRWHELYEESLQHPSSRISNQRSATAAAHANENMISFSANGQSVLAQSEVCPPQSQPPSMENRSAVNMGHMVEGVGLPMPQPQVIQQPPPPIQVLPQLTCAPVSYALPYSHPYSYLPGLPPFLHPPLSFHPANYTYAPISHSYYPPAPVTTAHLRPPQNTSIYTHSPIMGVPMNQGSIQQRSVLTLNTPPPTASNMPQPPQPQVNGSIPQLNQRQLGYLLSAYRVGMLAMETLARRVHDDRPQAKYARNPPYGEDVKWLLEVAKKLGTSYLQEFCICTVNSVASPFILHDIVIEAAHYLARSGTATLNQPLRSHLLTPLIQKCQQMFIACTHFKMYHITPAEYEDFVSIIRSARSAFQMTPGGMVQFNELLQSLRRSKSCKKDLWTRIATALAASV